MSMHRRLIGLLAIVALVLAACGGGGAASPSAAASAAPSAAAPSAAAPSPSEASTEPVTIEWWNLQVNDPGKALLKTLADEYMAAHPNVTINETVLENEALKTKIATAMQAGTPPDVFQSWGGGGLAEQVAAGLVKDITADVAPWADTMNPGAMGIYQVDGKQYGIPYNFGMVGFWYNKALFEQAGITAPPATWDELLTAVGKLKDAGITPIALGGKDKWPGMFWWAYLAIRNGGQAALDRGGQRRGLGRAGLRRCRHPAQEAHRPGAVPGGLPRGDLPERVGDHGQRQGRHGADGPVGPRCPGR